MFLESAAHISEMAQSLLGLEFDCDIEAPSLFHVTMINIFTVSSIMVHPP